MTGRMLAGRSSGAITALCCLLLTLASPWLAAEESIVQVDQIPGQAVLVDVRSEQEWSSGHVRGALHLPVDQIEQLAPDALPDLDVPIVTYCQAGPRAQRAAATLQAMGYEQARALQGGYPDLREAGFPVEE